MRPSRTLSIRLLLACATAATLPLACSPDAFYEALTPEPAVRLPNDEAPHHFGGGEWWYYTGMLSDDEGRDYGIEAVVFHIPEIPYLFNLARARMAHFAVLDVSTGRFVYDQSREFSPVPVFEAPQPGFNLVTDIVQASGRDGEDHLHAITRGGEFALDLTLTDERGPVLHGGRGYVPFGANGNAFYYSRPRMHAIGALEVDGDRRSVTGSIWFDHQWGNDLTNPWLKWDWFSIRLDDGTDIMSFVFPDTPGPVFFGTYIPADGDPISLPLAAVIVTPNAHWTSPRTGVTYPVGWNIDIPTRGLTLSVAAAALDQELDARGSTLNIYWEGLCTVTGTHGDQAVGGIAYVELANY